MTSESREDSGIRKLGIFIICILIVCVAGFVFYPLHRSNKVASNLTEGSVWNIDSSFDGTTVRIFGTADGWNGWKTIELKSLPQGIQVKDKVKVIPLDGGEFTIEKISDGKGAAP